MKWMRYPVASAEYVETLRKSRNPAFVNAQSSSNDQACNILEQRQNIDTQTNGHNQASRSSTVPSGSRPQKISYPRHLSAVCCRPECQHARWARRLFVGNESSWNMGHLSAGVASGSSGDCNEMPWLYQSPFEL